MNFVYISNLNLNVEFQKDLLKDNVLNKWIDQMNVNLRVMSGKLLYLVKMGRDDTGLIWREVEKKAKFSPLKSLVNLYAS